jgi:hypothetical protein
LFSLSSAALTLILSVYQDSAGLYYSITSSREQILISFFIMVQLSRFLASIALFSCTFAVPTGVSVRHHHKGATQGATCPGLAAGAGAAAANAKAIYFITNDACNSVVALKVAADGTLSDGSITGTGGAGMNAIDSATGGPAAPDALFSQGAVKVAGNVRKSI